MFPQPAGYDIIDQIGAGGMGVVYEAYQRATGRRVALKFLNPDQARNAAAQARFEREIELAARLSHPGIVQVLDSGRCEDRPFVVLEFVAGVELSVALPPGEAPLSAIVEALLEIADAVEYAHQRGVLHRDLKPSNVLRDEQGRFRLLDFGLAREVAAPAGATLSRAGQLLGTLAYMAPEQARGDAADISVRTDVFSLGAMLYELLTGRPPIDGSAPLPDVLSRIVAAEFAPPSRARPGVSADLDAITLKCLSRAPRDRYASAAEFRDDLTRAQEHRTIRARPLGRAARAARFLRRHAAISLTVAIALATVAAVGTTAVVRVIVERDRARLAETEARDRLRDAREALDFLTDQVTSELEPRGNTAKLRRDILAGTLEKLTSLSAETRSPLLHVDLGQAQTLAARVALELGDTGEAKRKIRAAIETLRGLQAEGPDVARDEALGTALRVAGDIAVQDTEFAAARADFDEAFALFDRIHRARPSDSAALRGVSLVVERYAVLAVQRGDPTTHRRRTEEMLGLKRELVARENTPLARSELSIALERWARCLLDTREFDRAEPVIREALTIREGLASEHPDNRRFVRGLSQSYEQMAELGRLRNQPAEDRAWTAKMADTKHALLKMDPQGWLAIYDMAVTLERLATHARIDGMLVDSANFRSEAAERYRELIAQQSDSASVHARLALCLRDSIPTLLNLGRFDEAEANARGALSETQNRPEFVLSRVDQLDVQAYSELCLAICASRGHRPGEVHDWLQAALASANELLSLAPQDARGRAHLKKAEELRATLLVAESQ